MNRAILSQRISSIQDDIQQLNSTLFVMDTTDIQRYPDNYEALSIDAALRAEHIACRLRPLIYTTTRTPKEDHLPSATSTMGILVEQHGDVMEITLPALLPKRRRQPSTDLLDPFDTALSQYAKERPMPRYKHCVVCFSSIYSREVTERRVRDYDNLEWKQFLDVAVSYLLVDNSGLLCDAYFTTELGENDCTRIFIMDSSHFSTWLKEREKVLDSITDL